MALGMAAGMLFLLSGSYGLAQQIGYVDISQPSEGNGASWSTAFKTLTNALTRIAGTGTTTLWVAQGIYYTPTAAGTDIKTNSLYGGYSTGGGARDWVANPTILDGGNSNRVLQKSTGANTTTLDGFTVRNGTNATSGGGLSCSAGSLNIDNCIFTANISGSTGGAIYHSAAATNNVFSNCTFTANRSTADNGGAIYFGTVSTNVFQVCTFVTNGVPANKAGGAIFENGSGGLLQLTSCTFSNNTSGTGSGGAIYSQSRLDLSGGNDVFSGNRSGGNGGAIYHILTGATNVFSNCTFTANGAGPGGAYHGGAIYFKNRSTNTFQSCVFVTNSAPGAGAVGGAFYENGAGGLLRLAGCTFSNNISGTGGGGAIYSQSTLDLSVGNNVFSCNQSGAQGGAIYHTYAATNNVFSNCTFIANSAGPSAAYHGGAIFFNTVSTNTFQSCLFVTNSAPGVGAAGGAILEQSAGGLLCMTSCMFSNNISGTGGGGAIYSQSMLDLSGGNNLFYGNQSGGPGGAFFHVYGATNNVYSNCTFAANTSANNGGAIYFSAVSTNVFQFCAFVTDSAVAGGAIYENGAGGLLRMMRCTFSNNASGTGSGGAVFSQSRLDLSGGNDVFYGNCCRGGGGGAIYHSYGATNNVYSNCTFAANSVTANNGGAFYFATSSTNVFQFCTFVTNGASATTTGGAIYENAAGGLLRMTSCTFSNNISGTGGGGAIYSQSQLDLSGGNDVFYGNQCSGAGGAIFHNYGATNNVYSNCTFAANRATANNGGAIYFSVVSTNVFQFCTFVTNSAPANAGGAIYDNVAGLERWTGCTFSSNICNSGGGGAIYTKGTLDLSGGNDVFYGNYAVGGSGGAIYHNAAVTNNVFRNCTFSANTGGGNGGAMFFAAACTATVANCAFVANSFSAVNFSGGAIYCTGAGLYSLMNCTFFANQATGTGQGGAVRNAAAGSTLNVTNCIFWGNGTGTGTGTNIQNGGTLNIGYSDVATNAGWVSAGTLNFGAGIINADPLFASTTAPYDLHEKSQGGRYSNGVWVVDFQTSPCIDAGKPYNAGDPYTFYSNEPMPNGGRVNLGAYGNTPQTSKSYLPDMCVLGTNGVAIANGVTSANPEVPSLAKGTQYGTVTLGAPVDHTFTITNNGASGAASLTLSGTPTISIAGNTFDFYTNGTAAVTNLTPGNTTTFTVRFDPQAVMVARTAIVSIASSDSSMNYTFALAGTGYSASASDMFVLGTNGVNIAVGETATAAKGTDFGSVATNLYLDNVFTVTNFGPATLTLTGATTVAIGGNTSDFFTNGTAVAASIAAGNISTLQIRFAPTAMGLRTALVTIVNNSDLALKDPYTFTLQGTGVNGVQMDVKGTNGAVIALGAAAAAASGTDFGTVLTNSYAFIEHVFTVTNAGIGTLTLTGATAVTISGNTGDFFTNGTALASSIVPGGSSAFQVHFLPTAPGVRTALVSIANNVLGKSPYTFALQGRGDDGVVMGVLGTNGANIAVGAGASLAKGTDWGVLTLNSSAVDHTFTITNQGVNALALSGSPHIALSGAADFTLFADAATPVASAGATTFTIRFNPSVGGVRQALVTIANSDTDQNPYTFALQASVPLAGVSGIVYVSPIATQTPENGSDWLHAYRTLTNALTSTAGVFWVAQGVYGTAAGGGGMDIKTNTLYGGFQGSETALSQRNWTLYPTIMDGANANRVLQKTVAGVAILDGFTVQNGTNAAAANGGGLNCTGGSLNICNCLFTNNLSGGHGGAIYHAVTGVTNIFSNCTFAANAAGTSGNYGGGAICFGNLGTNVFLACTFGANLAPGNSAGKGGAIYETTAGGLLQLTGCTFSNNASGTGNGGAIYSVGRIDLSGGNDVFYGNQSSGAGGAIYHSYGATNNVFSNCTFTANSSSANNGGAIYVATISTNVFQFCTFVTNSTVSSYAGGAIYDNVAGLERWTGCIFSNNASGTGGGGAIYTKGRIDLSGGNDVFCGNQSGGAGGAIYHNYGAANNVFSNCTFTANTSTNNNGGAVYFATTSTNVFLYCTFLTNNAFGGGGGGAIYGTGRLDLSGGSNSFYGNYASAGYGGAIFVSSLTGMTNVIAKCGFTGNWSMYGGGAVHCEGHTNAMEIYDSTFVNNHTVTAYWGFGGGGAVETQDGIYLKAVRCVFTGNMAGENGGAVLGWAPGYSVVYSPLFLYNCSFAGNGSPLYHGGAVAINASNNVLVNCSFCSNSCTGNGGAVYSATAGTSMYVTNCIFYGDKASGQGPEIYMVAGTTTAVSYCDIATSQVYVATGGITTYGLGITNADPLFASATAPYDLHEKSKYGRWTPAGWVNDSVSSPCIDAGDPASDYALEPRANGGRINMGAYGNTAQASRSRSGGMAIIVW